MGTKTIQLISNAKCIGQVCFENIRPEQTDRLNYALSQNEQCRLIWFAIAYLYMINRKDVKELKCSAGTVRQGFVIVQMYNDVFFF